MDLPDLEDRVFVVTGATSGIGRECARDLAAAGATVALVGRNPEKGRLALEDLGNSARHAHRLRFFAAEFGELAQVRRLADMLGDAYDKIDVLVNNAGAIFGRRLETADGFEQSFGVNHLAGFLLTGLLLNRLLASGAARIVNVSSGAHLGAHVNFDDIHSQARYSFMGAYGQSKLANVLFTRQLAVRLAGTGITSNAVHPGVVQTGFAQNNRDLFQFLVWLAGPFMLTARQGADTLSFLAGSPDVEGVSGEYFEKRKPARISAEARNPRVAARLWTLSEELTGAPFAAAGY